MKCRLVAYYRVSTAKQGASGLGLEAQVAAVAAHAASSGCDVIAAYTEVESGRKSDRTELGKAIAHAKRAKATLVIAKIDRLSRNVHFVSGLMESGVPFVACDMPTANKMTVHIIAAVAEGEALAISQRTKAALAAAKARGVKLGSPANLTDEARRKGSPIAVAAIKKNKVEAYSYIAPLIRELHEQGLSLRAIAAKLNEQKESTRSGKGWRAMQVSRVLALAERC
jgi:DNA invertase Pin-like site-specific DNA recombinase